LTRSPTRGAAVALALLGLVGCSTLREHFAGPDILFVATPPAVTLEMLRVASVTAEDVVVDLGSGDGRVVIAAARDFGARGVGIEIDPGLVNTSRDAALAAGVAERTTFLWQDLFVADLHAATVVTLYLRDDVNLKLRPKLLRELTPGTRVVSHDFDMGDWPPDRVVRVREPEREHTVYLWLVPAEAAGRWQIRIDDHEAGTLTLAQHYQVVAATLTGEAGAVGTAEGRLRGDRLQFTVDGRTFRGRVQGDGIVDGTVTAVNAIAVPWTARRVH
jgi:SAM-dependent methyltransferase